MGQWLGAAGLAILLTQGAFAADDIERGAGAEPSLEEIVVTGEFPGPGMWKVTKADDPSGHVLWIVGDPPPLPKTMTWRSHELEKVLAQSQELLADATSEIKPDEEIGLLRGLTLLPTALKMRKNPEDGLLKDQVPAELYLRWQSLKAIYLKGDKSVEEWRPIFAGNKLRRAAEKKFNLGNYGAVWDKLRKLIEKQKIQTTVPRLTYTFKKSDARGLMKQFSREKLADTECFATQLELVEALGRRDIENARAHAWATGDLASLGALPPLPYPFLPCSMAMMNAEVARDLVPSDIRERMAVLWVETAEAKLVANRSTLAIVPLAKLTPEDGFLARLRAKGYVIEAPK